MVQSAVQRQARGLDSPEECLDATYEHGSITCNGYVWNVIATYDAVVDDGLVTCHAATNDAVAYDVTYDVVTTCNATASYATTCNATAYDAAACNAAACNAIANDAAACDVNPCYAAAYDVDSCTATTYGSPTAHDAATNGLSTTYGVSITHHNDYLHIGRQSWT